MRVARREVAEVIRAGRASRAVRPRRDRPVVGSAADARRRALEVGAPTKAARAQVSPGLALGSAVLREVAPNPALAGTVVLAPGLVTVPDLRADVRTKEPSRAGHPGHPGPGVMSVVPLAPVQPVASAAHLAPGPLVARCRLAVRRDLFALPVGPSGRGKTAVAARSAVAGPSVRGTSAVVGPSGRRQRQTGARVGDVRHQLGAQLPTTAVPPATTGPNGPVRPSGTDPRGAVPLSTTGRRGRAPPSGTGPRAAVPPVAGLVPRIAGATRVVAGVPVAVMASEPIPGAAPPSAGPTEVPTGAWGRAGEAKVFRAATRTDATKTGTIGPGASAAGPQRRRLTRARRRRPSCRRAGAAWLAGALGSWNTTAWRGQRAGAEPPNGPRQASPEHSQPSRRGRVPARPPRGEARRCAVARPVRAPPLGMTSSPKAR